MSGQYKNYTETTLKNVKRVYKNKSGDERIKFLNQTKKAISLFDEQTNLKYHDLVVNQIESCDFRIAFIKKDFKTIFSKQNKRFVKRLKNKERLSLKLQYRFPSLYNLLKKIKS